MRPPDAPLRPIGSSTWLQIPALIAATAHCTAATQLAPPMGVDAENLTGALALYERLGFAAFWTSVAYMKDIAADD